MTRVAIIILNWNGIADTLTCIDSLLLQDYPNFHVTVIDNGSRDNSVQQLQGCQQNNPDKITVLINPKNLGFAGGVNTGITWALNKGYDQIALFNNDAIADVNWLSELVRAAKSDSRIGIATGLLLDIDGKEIDSTGEQYSKWGLPFPRNRGEDKTSAHASGLTFGATGGATLYRAELFRTIGLFDESFFAYYEDVDISFRAQLSGWKVTYTPKALAYHKQGASSAKIPGFTTYQTFKNLPWLFIKNVPTKLLWSIGVRFYLAYSLMYIKSFAHRSGWSATKGFIKSITRISVVLQARRDIQSNRTVSIKYIKSILWDDLPPNQKGLRKLRTLFTRK